MEISQSERRQIENEMIFRRDNEKVGDGLGKLDTMHMNDDNPDLLWDDSCTLNFKCECSDENCDQRIAIKLSVYKKIHKNRSAFIIKPNHQVKAIEKVTLTRKNYSVVEKHKLVPDPGKTLNPTSIDNTSKK